MVSNEIVLILCMGCCDTCFLKELSYILMDMLLNSLQYHLMYVLKKHILFAVSFSLMRNLLKFVYQSVCRFERNLSTWEANSKLSLKICIDLFASIGQYSKTPLYYAALHIHQQEQQFNTTMESLLNVLFLTLWNTNPPFVQ